MYWAWTSAGGSLGFCSSPTSHTGLCFKSYTKGSWWTITQAVIVHCGLYITFWLGPSAGGPSLTHKTLTCLAEVGLVLTLCWLILPRMEALRQVSYGHCSNILLITGACHSCWWTKAWLESALPQIRMDQLEDLALSSSATEVNSLKEALFQVCVQVRWNSDLRS